jgi:hypothetical protein
MSTRRSIYPHPFFMVDKKLSQFVAKTLALQNSPSNSTRRAPKAEIRCDEWNQASDESSR